MTTLDTYHNLLKQVDDPVIAALLTVARALQPSEVLTVEEAAEYLRIGKTRCYELCRSGEIPCLQIGRSIRVRLEDLRRFAVGSFGRSVV